MRVLEREAGLAIASDTECCGVTLAQCHLLLETEPRGSTSVTELSEIMGLDKSTLSRTVDGLCRAGLLDRQVDACCRRQQVITLTEAGREKARYINGLCDASTARLFDHIPSEKRLMVIEAAGLLAQAMRRTREKAETPRCAAKRKERGTNGGKK